MENDTGKLSGYCPLFDHDHAFSGNRNVMSQTTERPMTLEEGRFSMDGLFKMTRPQDLSEEQWENVLKRGRKLQ